MDGGRIFYLRPSPQSGANHRVRRRRRVVMRKTGIHLNESGVARLHRSMPGFHVLCKNLFTDCHKTRRSVNDRVLLAALGARFHESEKATVARDALGKIIKALDQLIHIHRFPGSQPLCNREVCKRKHSIIDEILTMDRRNARGEDDSDSGIEQRQGRDLARGTLTPTLAGQDHAKIALSNITRVDHSATT